MRTLFSKIFLMHIVVAVTALVVIIPLIFFLRSQICSRNRKLDLSHRLITHHLITDGSTVSGGQVNTVAAF